MALVCTTLNASGVCVEWTEAAVIPPLSIAEAQGIMLPILAAWALAWGLRFILNTTILNRR